MLPERITELLSAYVDGELGARERKNVTRILRKSGEARQMLHKLKQDSMILRKMPRRKTQMDLSGSVMGTISLRGITLPKIETVPLPPSPAPRPPIRKRRVRTWVGIAVGVLLVIAVGVASYFAFVAAFRGGHLGGPGVTPTGPEAPSTARSPAIPDKPLPVIGVMHEPETPEPGVPGVDPRKDERYGLGWTRPPAFVAAQPRLMLIQSMRDLDQPSAGQAFHNELRRDFASRIDLFCTGDTTLALDRLGPMFKAQGAALRLDAYAQVRVKQKTKTNYAIYCKDLTPEEWTLLVQQLAGEDKRATSRLFDKITVNPLATDELAKVLGGEPVNYEPPAGTGPLRVDISKDVSSQTGTQLVQGPPRPPPDGLTALNAVAIPYLPQPGFSREVRYIVENKTWRQGTIQVLLVLWNP